MPRQYAVRFRIYTAPGESPDLLEVIRLPAAVEEVDRLDRIPGGALPAVLFLSRGLLKGLGPEEWEALPAEVVVVASDSQARGEAEKAGRLFLSMEDFRGGGLPCTGCSAPRRGTPPPSWRCAVPVTPRDNLLRAPEKRPLFRGRRSVVSGAPVRQFPRNRATACASPSTPGAATLPASTP